jgi:membrane protein YdbS with pleckstrin-like domain
MLCPACQSEIPAGSSFCPKCGQRTDGSTQPAAAPPPAAGVQAAAAAFSPRGRGPHEPERELWSGGYSPKAMLGWWIVAGILAVIGVGVSIFVPNPITWIVAAVVVVGFALWLLVDLLVKRLSVHYKLTTEQLTHQTGLLTRSTNRIEIIDIDDVTMQQSLIERMLGVGSVLVVSSDRTHPKLLLTGIDNVERVSQLIDKAAREERRSRGAFIESV